MERTMFSPDQIKARDKVAKLRRLAADRAATPAEAALAARRADEIESRYFRRPTPIWMGQIDAWRRDVMEVARNVQDAMAASMADALGV